MMPDRSGKDAVQAKGVLREIASLAGTIGREVKIMEVCGTHTVSLRRAGIHSLLPENVRLVSGPGCPVCVTPTGYIDNALALLEEKDVIVATFGDMLKVPGSKGTALARYLGTGKVRMVYSPAELITIASETDKQVVFLGIGFETTIPGIAVTFLKARRKGIPNLLLYSAFKTVPAPLTALLNYPDRYFDGFLLPGHVSVIIGSSAYDFLQQPGSVPGVIAGFEPLDMLKGIRTLLWCIAEGHVLVKNEYPRAVRTEGNRKAQAVIEELLMVSDEKWRSLGIIPGSGLSLKPEFSSFDAGSVFAMEEPEDRDNPGCLCGKVILGKVIPPECTLFRKVCTPDHPVGPCMVSSEGTCAAYLRYGEE